MLHFSDNKTVLAATVMIFFFMTATVFAGDWWDGGADSPADNPTDTISKKTDEQGRVQEASRINWQEGYIEVMAGATADSKHSISQGQAYAIALKTARHIAYEKLAETVSGLCLTADATYKDEVQTDSHLKTQLHALVQHARVVKEDSHEFKDGSIWVEVTLGMRLHGNDKSVAAATVSRKPQPAAMTKIKKTRSGQRNEAVEHAPAPTKNEPKKQETVSLQTSNRQQVKPYTGLIVDARGLDARPAMLPQIVAENGAVLYSGRNVSPEYLQKMGLIGYRNSLAGAEKLERVGSHPLVVKAKDTAGRYHTDFVLACEDASRLTVATAQNDFLGQCRVVAVLGR